MKTIQELTTLIEELEKRIKSLSNSHTTLSQLIAMRDYLENIQTYLSELNSAFDTHLLDCQSHTEEIANMQSQINALNEKINNINGSVSNEQLEEINAEIENIKITLNNIQGNTSTSLEILENDIQTLQTDLATTQEEIQEIQTEIANINTTIGEQNTTLTNLQTTQTNLQTTQTNQASTINTLSNRLTTCENNVSTLTGGVDVSQINARLVELETMAGPTTCDTITENINLLSYNNTWYASPIAFSCKQNAMIGVVVDIKYEFTETTSTYVNAYVTINGTANVISTKISPTENPYGTILSGCIKAPYNCNYILFIISDAPNIKIKSCKITLYGTNIVLSKYKRDLSVTCYNGYMYVTKHAGKSCRYGKFLPTDTITPTSLPYSKDTSSYTIPCNRILYTPLVIKLDSGDYLFKDCFYLEQINNKAKYEICDSTDETTLADKYLEIEIFDAHTQLVGTSWGSLEFLAYQNGPAYIYKYKNGGKFIGGEVRMPESITYASPVINNYLTFENSKDYISSINVIVRGVSGYFYILNNYNVPTIKYKIQKGEYASAYLQQDGTINVYIVQNTTTYKYNFSIDTTNKTYIQNSYEVISNCEYVYEGLNGILFKQYRTTWSVVYPETTTSE